MRSLTAPLTLALWLCACADDAPRAPSPPPLPVPAALRPIDAQAPAPPVQDSVVDPWGAEADDKPKAQPAGRKRASTRRAKTSSKQEPVAPVKEEPRPVPAPKPASARAHVPAPPATPSPAPAEAPTEAPKGRVVIPKTEHLRVEAPRGLQADLDKDPRMQKWIDKAVAVIDRCYETERSRNAAAAGTIEVNLIMHENERPSPSVKQLPSALTPLVTCATVGLMSAKMPLFTGTEGTRYVVKLVFSN